MRGFLFAVVALAASLACASVVAAAPSGDERSPNVVSASLPWSGLSVGVNDDSGKSDSLRDWFYPLMSGEGLRLDTLTVTWDESDPLTIPARAALTEAIATAQRSGIAIELDLYPLHSQAFTHGKRCKPSADPKACGDSTRISEFATWTAQVARAFPSVHEFVVMNECNQPRFINPQWDTSGANQSAAICGRGLAAAYDALKAVNPSIFVWGVGLSPRGNDDPRAVSNSSTSPTHFLADLGAWFKAFVTTTQRATPLMDGLDFHPYPVPQSLPFATGYANKNDATITNLARVYEAFFHAFNGSPQPTIGQQRGGGLPVSLNETGIQTAPADSSYVGWQPSTTTAGGVARRWATQSYQARWYLAMLNLVACDPNIRLVNIFHLLDEPNGSGWQSGLYFADGSPKVSAGVVRSWIESSDATCHGHELSWRPGMQHTLPKIDLSTLPLPSATAAMPPTLPPTTNPDPNALSLAVPPPAAPATITPPPANPLAPIGAGSTPDPATVTPLAPNDTPFADTPPPADTAQTGG